MTRDATSLWLVFAALLAAQPGSSTGEAARAEDQARALQAAGSFREARSAYQRALADAREHGDSSRKCGILNELASLAISLGEYQTALREADEAASHCHAAQNTRGEAVAWNAAGLSFLYRSHYPEALERFEKAIALDRGAGDREREARHLNNAGNVYYYQGRYLEALRAYQTAREVVRHSFAEPWQPAVAQLTAANLAMLYQRLGMYHAALELYRNIQTTPQALNPSTRARMLANAGVLFRRLGDPVKALQTYREAQALFAREAHADGELTTLKNIGIVQAFDLGNLHGALAAFNRVLTLARRTSSRRELMQAYLYRGEVYYRRGDGANAWKDWQSALDLARGLGAVDDEWKALHGQARILSFSGDARAGQIFDQAVSLIESVRGRLQMPALRSEFLAGRRDVYDAYIRWLAKSALAERERIEAIFKLMERARARVLLDLLARRAGSAHPQTRNLAELRARISDLYAQRLRASGTDVQRLESELTVLENDYLAAERRLSEARNGGPPSAGPVSLPRVHAALPPGTALIDFWSTEDWLAVVTVTPGGVSFHASFLTPEIREQLERLVATVPEPGATNWEAPARAVGGILLRDLNRLRAENVHRLVIVPDGLLNLVPFDILVQPGTARRLLAADYEISLVPAAAVLLREPRRRSRWLLPWAQRLVAFAAGSTAPAGGQDLLPGDEAWGLPRSEEEVKAIAKLLPGRAEIRIGRAAQKRGLLELGHGRTKSPVLHLATHARADEDDPPRSRILLAGERPDQPFDYVFLDEILGMDLREVDLVTLSACDTARGKLVAGEGVQSLSRAFLAAGANTVVSSLWRVNDRAAAEFMKQFYFELGRGSSRGAALRAAKLRFMESRSEFNHPSHWAAFVLVGESHTALSPRLPWLAVLGPAAGAVAGLLWLLRRRTHKPAKFSGADGTGNTALLAGSRTIPRT